MSEFRSAVTDLVVTAVAASVDLEEVVACHQAVLAELTEAADQEWVPALRRLAETIALTRSHAVAGVVAETAVAIVAAGGPPGVVLGALLDRLEEALATGDGAAESLGRAARALLSRDAECRERAEERAGLRAWLAAADRD